MKDDKRFKRISKVYLLIASILAILSLLSLFFKEWVLIPIVLVCSLFGYFSLILFYKQNVSGDESKYGIYTILRYVFMVIGLVISGLLVMFTMPDPENKKRYFLICLGALPYFLPTVSLLLGDKNNG